MRTVRFGLVAIRLNQSFEVAEAIGRPKQGARSITLGRSGEYLEGNGQK